MAAFCMAVFFRGLSAAETFALTDAMVGTGRTLDLRGALGRTVVDKHSTGGVGDKTSIAVGPVVAACGVPFGKMSGRGLGHTGGTLDKLEAIPGFRVELTEEEFVAQVRDVGIAIIGQSADLVPADKRLYALRDVTATVDNVSLIAASIMSKKIAAGRDRDRARRQGRRRRVHEDDRGRAGARPRDGRARRTRRPAGRMPSHRHGPAARPGGRQRARDPRGDRDAARRGPARLQRARSPRQRRAALALRPRRRRGRRPRLAEQAIADGSASATYERWVEAQGGNPAEDALEQAPLVKALTRPTRATSGALRALPVGLAALHLGAGRATKDDAIDYAVGIVCLKKRGDAVAVGEPLAEIHARTDEQADAAARDVAAAYEIRPEPPPTTPIVLESIG